MDISVVVPLANDSQRLQRLCDVLDTSLQNLNLEYEILLRDDASRDGTRELLERICPRRRCIKYQCFAQPVGFGSVLRHLFLEAQGEAVVYMDAAIPFGYKEFAVLYHKTKESDIVVASRYAQTREKYVAQLTTYSRTYEWFCRFFLGLPVLDPLSGFVLFRREHLVKMDLRSQGREIFFEIFAKAAKSGLTTKEVPLEPVLPPASKVQKYLDALQFASAVKK